MAIVFFSYSHQDEELRNRLEKHLALLKRQGLVEAWHDRCIDAGSELDQVISSNLESANIILLLVSVDFLASDYCYSREMLRAMKRHEEGTAVVIPVILRPCDWHSAPFGKLLAIPRDGKPITSWADIDEPLTEIALQIRARLEAGPHRSTGRAKVLQADSTRPRVISPEPAAATGPRSSNLRLKKTFTDHDRDTFLHESFELFAQYFEGSLAELEARNSGVQTHFRRIDANCFTAAIYQSGNKASECAVRMGGIMTRSITLVQCKPERDQLQRHRFGRVGRPRDVLLSTDVWLRRGRGAHEQGSRCRVLLVHIDPATPGVKALNCQQGPNEGAFLARELGKG